MDNVCKPKKKYELIYLACVFICLVSLFTQESILFGFEILELDFKTSRQVGTLSILSGHFLFFCCCFFVRSKFSCLFVFFLKKEKPSYYIFADVVVNKATIGLRVGITQRRNSKWPPCDVLILNFTILSSRKKNGISLLKFLEIKSILSPWGRVAVSNISLVPKSPTKITGVCGLKHLKDSDTLFIDPNNKFVLF